MEQTEKKELTREEKLELEERAIETLLALGVKFSVPLKIKPYKEPKFHRWVRTHLRFLKLSDRDRRVPADWDVSTLEVPNIETMAVETIYQRNFHIKPLYLGTIDYLRKLYIPIEYDEGKIQERPLEESQRLFQHTARMAEIAAVAVLNSPSVVSDSSPSKQSKEVRELAQFFLTHLTSKRLEKLASTIQMLMDSEGFTNSIRLISVLGRTMPKSQSQDKPRANLVE